MMLGGDLRRTGAVDAFAEDVLEVREIFGVEFSIQLREGVAAVPDTLLV